MFCSNCGAEGSGNFCSKCGAPLNAVASSPSTPAPAQDWTLEVRYETLIRHPEVRDKISKHAAMASKGLSGEEFLAMSDKLIPLGFSLEKLGSVLNPIYTQLGLKTGKNFSETISRPTGAVLVSAICSLARNGQSLQQVRQFEDGCVLEARLPSDMWSFVGNLYVCIRKADSGTLVDGSTKIGGQLYDWGKSKRCLDTLFSDLKATPA